MHHCVCRYSEDRNCDGGEDELMHSPKKRKKGGKNCLVAALVLLAVGLGAACGITKPTPETPAPTSSVCACFTDPTGNWRCTEPFVNAPQGVLNIVDLVSAWAPVLATGKEQPEIATILSHIKVVACTPELVV